MRAVSNTSPLIFYARIGRLDILGSVFGDLRIPVAVRTELLAKPEKSAHLGTLFSSPWLTVQAVTDRKAVLELTALLDPGEAEAIALAKEIGGQTAVLLDDRAARRAAQRLRLRVFGSAGILVIAKRQRRVPVVRPLLDDLLQAGLYLAKAPYNEVLRSAGE